MPTDPIGCEITCTIGWRGNIYALLRGIGPSDSVISRLESATFMGGGMYV